MAGWLWTKEEEQPKSWWSSFTDGFTLTYYQRIVGFGLSFVVGLVFCFMSTWFILMPRQFAKFYSLGSMSILISTFFLTGPVAQLRNMCQPPRLYSSVIYFAALILTLYSSIVLQMPLLALFSVVIQIVAAFWYGLSYIPFAQSLLQSGARTVLPL